MDARRLIILFSLATLFTLLNCMKPLHMDDGDYYAYARQIAKAPWDPYGFELKEGVPANHNLAPPVLLYWLAIASRLFGDQLILWKLWLFPLALLFVMSLDALLRRFAPGMELPLVWLTALSPAFLPSWNLMLDLPALAISLFGLTLFMRACEKQSWRVATAAGLTLGLAMQTKYSAFVAPSVALLYAVLFGRWRMGAVAAGLAVFVFVAWEGFIALRYGESHFLYSLAQRNGSFWARIGHLALPFFGLLGGVAPALALMGLTALKVQRRTVVAAGMAMCLGYVMLGIVPESYAELIRDAQTGRARLTLDNVIFGACGLVVFFTLGAVAWRLLRANADNKTDNTSMTWRLDWFLVLWLALEFAGYFVLSPFPAVRRLTGFLLVATLLAGRLASRSCGTLPRKMLIREIAIAGAALGGCFFVVDMRDALAQRKVARNSVRQIHRHQPDANIWCYGAWGFKHYGMAAGMKPIVGDESAIKPGDWLVAGYQPFEPWPGSQKFQPVGEVVARDRLPVRMMPCFYGGRTAFEHCDGPRFYSTIYRSE